MRIILLIISFTIIPSIVKSQPCNGSWALQRPLTQECVTGQWIGWQNGGNPAGCPINPTYVGVQSNTFTFDQPVAGFSMDFRGFDGSVQCPRIEIKINGIFYPLTGANLSDIPTPSTCTGLFSNLALTSEGYITVGSAGLSSAQGRIFVTNIIANSVTVSTNDGNGTVFSNPFNCNSIVPIQLLGFTASHASCKTQLLWQTGTETNVAGIIVQRSEDGIAFEDEGQIMPKGDNSEYVFLTYTPTNTYYRLKIIDLDNSFDYSETLYVASSCFSAGYQIFPNPSTDQIRILGIGREDWIRISDITGREHLRYDRFTDPVVDVRSLAPGLYIIQIGDRNSIKSSLKFIKK